MKNKKAKAVMADVKAARKASREEEIKMHGKLLNYRKIAESKKVYNRKKNKADTDEALPYFFYLKVYVYQIETRLSAGINILSPS